ncbi:MAG: hypothetical protein ACXVP1_03005 [Thermoleophilia bacterium]
MTDGQLVEQVLAKTSRAQRRLSLAEVMTAGLPAVYQQYGEQLIYLDGRILDASDPSAPAETSLIVEGEADQAVGVEFGWRHSGGCHCRFCASDRPVMVTATASPWRAREATG